MSDLKISETARKLAEDLENTVLTEGDVVKRIVPNAERIQLVINEACRPLVEALQQITNECCMNSPSLGVIEKATLILQAHRKEHGE